MAVAFDAGRWERAKADWGAWWRGALDRPMISVHISGHDAGRPEPALPQRGYTSFYDASVPAEAIVDRWDYDLGCERFYGDAIPFVRPDFGPGVIAAFLGCRLTNGKDRVWFHPEKDYELADLEFTFNPEAYWFRRIAEISRVAVERWRGAVQVCMSDIGGAMDILSSFRPSEKLLLDLYDEPEAVRRLSGQLHEVWHAYFDAFNAILQPLNPGYSSWTQMYSADPYYMLQCDFSYMISPQMYEAFVHDELAATCRRLANPFYHCDGIGQLPHLDRILSIPELKGVQWVPGDGQPDVCHWPEVYRKIQAAGKRIQVFGNQSSRNLGVLDALVEQLGTARNLCLIARAERDQEDEVVALLEKYGVPVGG